MSDKTNPTDPRIEAAAREMCLSAVEGDESIWNEMSERDKGFYRRRCALILRAADEAAWLPIESAPKDRTKVLLTDGKEVSQGWYDEWDRTFVRHDEAQAGDGFSVYYDEWEPTLWRPLPKAPKP